MGTFSFYEYHCVNGVEHLRRIEVPETEVVELVIDHETVEIPDDDIRVIVPKVSATFKSGWSRVFGGREMALRSWQRIKSTGSAY